MGEEPKVIRKGCPIFGALFFCMINGRKGDTTMQVKYNLLVDFAYPNKSNIVMISENDTNSRVCHFTMLFNKEAFDMTDVVGARVKGIRGDNIIISDTATIMQDALGKNTNVLEYSIPLTISEYTGKTTMAITLVGEDGSEITSFEFYVSTRNALYNEDDVVTEEETQSFSQLLNRIQQKLAELENIASITAIKNPMPINIFLDGKEYNYIGDKEVNIELGNIAYIDEKNPLDPEEAVDETAARAAVDAANRIDGDIEALKGLAPQIEAASDYAAQARQSATDAYNYAQELNVVPQIIVGEKSGGERPITIITAAGTQVATIVDGLQGERGEKGDPGEKGERGERGLMVTVLLLNLLKEEKQLQ